MIIELSLHSLSSLFIPYEKLSADWKTYNKEPERFIHRFISINKGSFSFLGVEASFQVRNYKSGLLLRSSKYIGATSLRSPITGKPAYDLNVSPMYGGDLGQVITLLGEKIDIEFAPMKLSRPLTFRVPIYFSCIQYMKAFEKAIGCKWTKFDSTVKIESRPTASTDWSDYSKKSIFPNQRLQFANKKSYHSIFHKEWLELTSLLKNVIEAYDASHPPLNVRGKYESLVSRLKNYLRTIPHDSNSITLPTIQAADPPQIKKLKIEARNFIQQENDSSKSWRIEIAVLFERFVQHVIEKAANRGGWHSHQNVHYVIQNPSGIHWALRYIEPDIVLMRDDRQWVIDAKYKSHMYNRTSRETEQIKASFREDYHQVLAYTSFATSQARRSMIVYPYSSLCIETIVARSPLTGVFCETKLVGLPFSSDAIDETINQLSEALSDNFHI